MKILYSQIKELIPGLKADPKEVGEVLTYTGFMMDSFTEVDYKGEKDYLIGLEIRQNRADCLSVIGLAREIAAYYGLEIPEIKTDLIRFGNDDLAIKIEATDYVKRVLAVRIDNVINKESPDWLKEYLIFYGISSINLLVDLSNYVMLLTGYPSHLIDYSKIKGPLIWTAKHNFNEIITLFGSPVKLQKDAELIIKDERDIIALAGIVGGRYAEIDMNTKSIIAEIAVYDRSIIRKNSRSLNIVTEASHRLEKDLDPTSSLNAMELLVSLLIEYCGGNVSSNMFDYYPNKRSVLNIKFDSDIADKYSGINIGKEKTLEILKNLGFKIERDNDLFSAMPPIYRIDVSVPEDIAEEVIRIYRYDKIPFNEIPKIEVVQDITPKNIIVSDKIRDILTVLGFDEILSCPLVRDGENESVNYLNWNIISTQNSVNELYPNLRQSVTSGLVNQFNEYIKKGVDIINIFEIGKVFGERSGTYKEHEVLGIMSASDKECVIEFKNKMESVLRMLGLNDIKYLKTISSPKIANPNSCWDIYNGKENIGIIYKLIPQEGKNNAYITEINIAKIIEIIINRKNNPVVEITKKLIALDMNVELDKEESIIEYLDKIKERINNEHVWSIVIVDQYPANNKIKYTIRVTYMNLSDQEAKTEHFSIFK
ncbi:MAG: phenylalanine--tRNA ligase beta subunit-related protein [Candidatus Pacebacteria bacterium]|nr:phenylalanine--tRNA ligase beta subunit-related protein [Candidatus Paceibacterota bacterium]